MRAGTAPVNSSVEFAHAGRRATSQCAEARNTRLALHFKR